MSVIQSIHGREILDSRGNPTVEAEIQLESGARGVAAVPSGASTGSGEALELRDRDPARYGGKGVLQAVRNLNTAVAKTLIGIDASEQREIDARLIALDKNQIGANASLAASLAAAVAAAEDHRQPLYRYLGGVNAHVLPVPMMNIVNGGAHSDAPIAFQEFMIRPIGAPNFIEAVRIGSEIFHALRKLLKLRGLSTAVGDEGGFAPAFRGGIDEAIATIVEAIEQAGYRPGTEVSLALDCAASEFYHDGEYDYSRFEGDRGKRRDRAAQIAYLEQLIERYPIDSIEDGMAETDWEGWVALTRAIGGRCQLVGDDLFVTNTELLRRGIREHAGNAILIKPNQIGTLSETLDAIETAKQAGFAAIVSHRSGETGDTFIADLAVGTNAGQIKTGSLSRTDRVAKYNRLMRIAEELGPAAVYGNTGGCSGSDC